MSKESKIEGLRVERHIWSVVSDEALLQAACNLFRVPPSEDLTTNERKAADRALESGAAYLGTIGKTDLAEMSEQEVSEFGVRVIVGYRKALREIVEQDPPF